MLTKKQNFIETIKGGHPDRFVNQYEALGLIAGNPFNDSMPIQGGDPVQNSWGVWLAWPEGVVSGFPLHDLEHVVIKDIEHWKDYVTAPDPSRFTEADWEPQIAQAEAVDSDECFPTAFVAPGIFEQCHHLLGIDKCLLDLTMYPDEMHELVKTVTEYELKYAEQVCEHVKPEAIFHHDDWGTQRSTFMSLAMFDDFYLDAYRQVYGYYKDHGVQVIVHHSDSYAETLVPEMIQMGIDVWQGAMSTNDIPRVIERYGGEITIMGGIDNGIFDRGDSEEADVRAYVDKTCEENGTRYYIPCATMGGPESLFPGLYDIVSDEIDIMSKKLF